MLLIEANKASFTQSISYKNMNTSFIKEKVYNRHMEHSLKNHLFITLLHRFGQIGFVLFITLISILISMFIITLVVINVEDISFQVALPIAIVIPSIVAPLVSWKIVALLVELERMEKKMRKLATYDALTTLLSRQAFFHDAQNWLNIRRREPQDDAIVMIDIDAFKKINDTYGHSTGDDILSILGKFLKNTIRDIDIIGRLGGEEFGIVFWNISKKEALQKLESLRVAIENLPIKTATHTLYITVSMGITFCTKGVEYNLHTLLKEADIALYKAKNSGRNCIISYNKNMKMTS